MASLKTFYRGKEPNRPVAQFLVRMPWYLSVGFRWLVGQMSVGPLPCLPRPLSCSSGSARPLACSSRSAWSPSLRSRSRYSLEVCVHCTVYLYTVFLYGRVQARRTSIYLHSVNTTTTTVEQWGPAIGTSACPQRKERSIFKLHKGGSCLDLSWSCIMNRKKLMKLESMECGINLGWALTILISTHSLPSTFPSFLIPILWIPIPPTLPPASIPSLT